MIPTVSLEQIEAAAPEALDALRTATRDIGVFYVDPGAALAPGSIAELFDQARGFFALPERDKHALDLSLSPHYRGYVGVGEEFTNGVADLKESFEFAKEISPPASDDPPPYYALYGPNQWPDAGRLPGFRPALDAYTAAMDRVALAVLRGLSRTLDQPDIQGDLCSFSRLIYYSDPSAFGAASARLDAHTDHALITVILQDVPGLEVETGAGEWRATHPPAGTFVVFPGELMEFWTRGYYRARLHRVQNAAMRGERVSIATFFLPDLRSTLAPVDPVSSPRLAAVDRTLPGAAIVVGEREWARANAIFPEEGEA